MKYKIRKWLRNWLGIVTIENSVETIHRAILHQESNFNGFFVLKKHLNRPDKPLPSWKGKPIEQD